MVSGKAKHIFYEVATIKTSNPAPQPNITGVKKYDI